MRLFNLKTLLILFVGGLLIIVTSYALSGEPVQKVIHTHYNVKIAGFKFVPKNIIVKPGDIVTWTNEDVVPHNVYGSSNKKPISLDLATGESFSYTVPKAPLGIMKYFCSFHPSMIGSLTNLRSL